jgi:hypothetical protein
MHPELLAVWPVQLQVLPHWPVVLQMQLAIALALTTRPINSNKLPTTVNI